jgi:hypothetical protein
MNICYLDFWGGFDPNCNWFNLMFRDLLNDREINFNSTPQEADIIFFSSFGNSIYAARNTKAIKIFYTGENEPPRLDIADFSLSHDFDTHGGRNFRLPHWYMYINWWGEPNFPHARISVERLFRKWDPEAVWNRKEFCSIIIGNPVRNRIEVAQKLNEYRPVHGYGKVFGNYFSSCKVDLMENYRYNICFENSITEGYVTEKLLEAKVAGCVPIYFGDDSASRDFNEKCYINYTKMNNHALLSKIAELENDFQKFQQICSEELFHIKPNLDSLYSFLKGAIKL